MSFKAWSPGEEFGKPPMQENRLGEPIDQCSPVMGQCLMWWNYAAFVWFNNATHLTPDSPISFTIFIIKNVGTSIKVRTWDNYRGLLHCSFPRCKGPTQPSSPTSPSLGVTLSRVWGKSSFLDECKPDPLYKHLTLIGHRSTA